MSDLSSLIKTLEKLNISYVLNEPMKAHTTFRIGGAADILVTVDSLEQLRAVIGECEGKIPYMILGKGSNLLVSDDGVEGVMIELSGDFKRIEANDTEITCGAGVSLSKLCLFAFENSLSGLEFAYGIPGTVGGAVFMNAGAYGGETKDVVEKVVYMSKSCEIGEYDASQLEFSYRSSVFKKTGEAILFAKYRLHKDSKAAIKARMDDFMNRRKTKQPLEYPSAGSVFKRPEGAYAGALIEGCGLKGVSVGGAQVSEKHSGFIINKGGATCSDVTGLVALIQNKVKEETGYTLEREIIKIGR